jgi:hypothetical protein
MRDDLNMTPGDLEDVENATAYANRTGRHGVAGERPATGRNEPMEGAPMENGELDRPARSTVREGDDIGGGQRARRDGSDPQNPAV